MIEKQQVFQDRPRHGTPLFEEVVLRMITDIRSLAVLFMMAVSVTPVWRCHVFGTSPTRCSA
jgi:hypothetical protein